jgi:hypothetical protein
VLFKNTVYVFDEAPALSELPISKAAVHLHGRCYWLRQNELVEVLGFSFD